MSKGWNGRMPAGRVAYVDGRYAPHGQASVHIEDRGLQLGDAVYEVCGVTDGVLMDAAEFGEGAVEVGDVVEHRVPEHEVKAFVVEGQRLGLGDDRGDVVQSQARGGARQLLQHPGRDVGRGQPPDQPLLHQVEREVAGPGADLERVVEAIHLAAAERLDQLRPHLILADPAEVDPPLGVVLVRGRVVVAGVYVLDVLRRRRR